MLKLLFIIITLSFGSKTFSQWDKSLPSVSGINFTTDSDYSNLKSFIFKTTGYVISKHPLFWVKEEIENNLLKTDTLFDSATQRRKVYYYSKDFGLFQIMTTSTDRRNFMRGTKIYDNQNNLIFDEWLDNATNTIKRIRRGYDDYNNMLFECVVWQEVGIGRLTIMNKFKKPIMYNKRVCNCDF